MTRSLVIVKVQTCRHPYAKIIGIVDNSRNNFFVQNIFKNNFENI